MKRFNSARWITENKHGNNLFNDELTTIFTEIFIQNSLPKGILKENLSLQLEAKISNVIKDKVNKLPSNVKDEFKEFQQSLKDKGINFLEYLKSAAATFKGVSEEEVPALLASLDLDGNISEAKKEVNSIEDLVNLEPGDTFIWNQDTANLPADNYSVFGNSDKSQSLINGQSYTLSTRVKSGDPADTDIRGITLQNNAAREKTSKFKGILTKIGGKKAVNAFISLGLLAVMIPQMFGNSLNTAQDAFEGDKIESVVTAETGINFDNTLQLTADQLTGSGGGTDVAQVLDITGGDNPGEAGVEGDFNNDENSIVTGGKFKVGEYELSDSEKDAFVEQAFGALASLMDAQIGDSNTKKLTVNSNITLDYSGYISNSGDDADIPNDGSGGSLQQKREGTALEIATAVKEKLDNYQQDKFGKKIIDIKLNKIDNSSFEDQNDQDATDYLATQGFKVKTNVNLDFDESGEPIELVQNDFEYAQYDVTGGGGPTGNKTGGDIAGPDGPIRKDDEKDDEKDDKKGDDDKNIIDEPIIPPPSPTFLKVNRKSQIAIMLGVINGESNIYALIRQDEKAKNIIPSGNQADGSSLTETEYFKLAGMQGEENTPSNPKLVELSKLIIALEKEKSESIRKMVNQSYGKEVLLKGAKVRQSSPGAARKSQFTKGKISTAENHLFGAYLNDIQEGIVSDLLPNFINQSQINDKKLEITGYYGSMYAAEGSTSDTQLPTIQLDVLQSIDKNAQKELGKQGFDSSALGLSGTKDSPDAGKYQFLNKDVENIKKKIDNNSVLVNKIKLIKTEKDLKCLIKLIYSLFQDQFSNSQSSTQKLKQVGMQIKEEEEISPLCKDISKILSRQEFELAFGKVNTVKELEETILKIVIPLIDPNLQKNKALIKRSIAQAAKDIEDQNRKQKIDTPNKPSSGFSSSTTSTTGNIDIDKFEYVPSLYTTKEGKRKSLKTLAEELGYIK